MNGMISAGESLCGCLECICPKCGHDWPSTILDYDIVIDNPWKLCKASKIYKGKVFLVRWCNNCDDEIVEVFWREKYDR